MCNNIIISMKGNSMNNINENRETTEYYMNLIVMPKQSRPLPPEIDDRFADCTAYEVTVDSFLE